MALFVGTDIGGTFTDLVGYDTTSGRLFFGKTLSTPADLVEAVVTCLAETGIAAGDVDVLKHGTTQIINTLLERSGARTALLTTKGFRDIVEIGRASRPLAFDLDYARQPPLTPAPLRLEIDERVAANGTVLAPLTEAALEAAAAELEALEVEAVAVSFLNSYRNPAHEEAAAAFLRQRLPGVFISAGTELSREWFEYERSSTAIANAYVGPRARTYLDRLEQTLRDSAFTGRLFMMASSGGVLAPSRAVEEPIGLVESGPVGGSIGAGAYASVLGIDRLIAFDMGGTTAKCALIDRGRFEVQPSYYVGGYDYGFPIRTPVLDITEVGTGGGSIASVAEDGTLLVGPRSAGADPGPVGFGRGGSEPTVTDANLALDRISGGEFLGGTMALDRDAARAAIVARVGRPLGYGGEADADRIAQGILDLANVQMAAAIKAITVERGHDARDFALFAFGGGGPMHAVSLARELRIPTVIVPPEPGNFSALGMLFADARIEETRTVLLRLSDDGEAALREHAAAMQETLAARLKAELEARQIAFEATLEMRFVGQRHTITVNLAGDYAAATIREAFFAAYRRRFGFLDEAAPIEAVSLRVAGIAVTEKPDLAGLHTAPAGTKAAPKGSRQVYFAEAGLRLETPVYRRGDLPVGTTVEGPAVIEEFGSTTVLGPGDRLTVGRYGELAIAVAPAAVQADEADTQSDGIDPIAAEVMIQGLCAIPNVIDRNIVRTAYSVLVSEYKDFAVGMVDGNGKLICQSKGGLPIFVANALSAAVGDGLKLFGKADLQAGDVVITNTAATMGQHLNNVVMYTPIRVSEADEGLVGFMAIVGHWMDVGGMVPGSCTTTRSTEIYQEGIQFPTLKLLKRGVRAPEIYRLIEANCRFTPLVLGDMESQLAGVIMGRDMTLELVAKFGATPLRAAIGRFWSRSDQAVRTAIRAIPDGTYEASSFLDDDGINRGVTLPINVSLTVAGDQMTVDLSGLADQVTGPWNSGFQGGAVAAVRIACKLFFASEAAANDGTFRAINIVCRPGTFMSALPPAAIACSGHNLPSVVDTILRALGKALPGRVPAAHSGTYSAQIILDRGPKKVGYHLEAVAGGWGAAAHRDGNGPFRSTSHGDTPEVPVELQEATYPYRVKLTRLRQDSGGPGRHRGGLGMEKTYQILGPAAYVAMFDRTKCPPWGIEGGGDGRPGRVEIWRHGKLVRTVIKDDLPLEAGDEVRLFSAGGGGCGDPLSRPLEMVVADVRAGYVSRESAAADYGVAVDDDFRGTELPGRLARS